MRARDTGADPRHKHEIKAGPGNLWAIKSVRPVSPTIGLTRSAGVDCLPAFPLFSPEVTSLEVACNIFVYSFTASCTR
jgi:hypothetical protein